MCFKGLRESLTILLSIRLVCYHPPPLWTAIHVQRKADTKTQHTDTHRETQNLASAHKCIRVVIQLADYKSMNKSGGCIKTLLCHRMRGKV